MSPISLLAACARIHARGVIDPRAIDGEVTCLVRRGSCKLSHAILPSPTVPEWRSGDQGLGQDGVPGGQVDLRPPPGHPTGAPWCTWATLAALPCAARASPRWPHDAQHFATLCLDSWTCWRPSHASPTFWYLLIPNTFFYVALSKCSPASLAVRHELEKGPRAV